jgi:5-methylcytosine-specific restriction endonuclease McrA
MNKQMGLSQKDKLIMRDELYFRDGTKCHYCQIDESDFRSIWGDSFYGGIKRGGVLEIDRKDNEQGYYPENCILACAICNMAKSDKFKYDEFKKVGEVIKEIWQQRNMK